MIAIPTKNKYFPLVNGRAMEAMVQIANADKYNLLLPVGDLAKRTPIINIFHFVGVRKEGSEGEKLNPKPQWYNKKKYSVQDISHIQALIQMVLRYTGKNLVIMDCSKGEIGYKEFYNNYNPGIVKQLRKKILAFDDRLLFGFDDELYVRQGKKIEIPRAKDLFKLAGVEYFPPHSKKNV